MENGAPQTELSWTGRDIFFKFHLMFNFSYFYGLVNKTKEIKIEIEWTIGRVDNFFSRHCHTQKSAEIELFYITMHIQKWAKVTRNAKILSKVFRLGCLAWWLMKPA